MFKKTIHSFTLATSLLFASVNSLPANASADPFIGEIQMVGFNFAPRGWAMCDGQLLPISNYTALFSLLGTTYGGDGRTTFALPDLRGRVAIHPGNGPGLSSYQWGQKGGAEKVTLSVNHIPSHSHGATTSLNNVSLTLHAKNDAGNASTAEGNVLANISRTNIYSSEAPDVDMDVAAISFTGNASTTVDNTGGSLAHENRMPYLAIYHVIALQGSYPSRN